MTSIQRVQGKTALKNKRIEKILKILKKEYPDAKCSLRFSSPFELLVATILSAQCTDERVNQVTPELFKRFSTPYEMSRAGVEEIELLIRSINFFRNKARAIHETSQILVDQFQGQVPADLDQLTRLRGVGRKTANVVLGVAFSVPSLVVDTHVGRLSRRMGFTSHSDPAKIEQDLMKILPQEDWNIYNHLIIDHGRKTCKARKALCSSCVVSQDCPKIGVT